MTRTAPLKVGLLFLFLCATPLSAQEDTTEEGFLYHASIKSSMNPVTADYLDRAVTKAEEDGARALLLQLDTPGGLMSSTKKMKDRILNAEIPIIVWIGPGGARAASAGVFLTYAGHISAMATGTSIGAAHPVRGGGGDLEGDMEKKVVNDAVAQLQSLADKRNRNRKMAETFIRESTALPAKEANEKNVVDLLAESPEELMKKLDQRTIQMNETSVTLTASLERRSLPMTWQEKFLDTLVNPNLVYFFVIFGVFGLIAEFSNPGIGVGGVIAAFSFLLALYGLSILPVNYVGLTLLIAGLGLMVADIFVPSLGLLTIGGLVSFFLGSTMLFRTHAFSVSTPLVLVMTGGAGLLFLLIGYLIVTGQFREVEIGEQSMEGETGTVKQDLDPDGMIHVQGEYWSATSTSGDVIPEGSRVRVVRQNDQTLDVEPIDDSSTNPSS